MIPGRRVWSCGASVLGVLRRRCLGREGKAFAGGPRRGEALDGGGLGPVASGRGAAAVCVGGDFSFPWAGEARGPARGAVLGKRVWGGCLEAGWGPVGRLGEGR
jgi:hypothetical protein